VTVADLRQWIADTRALLDRVERSLAPVDVSGETFDQWVERWRGGSEIDLAPVDLV